MNIRTRHAPKSEQEQKDAHEASVKLAQEQARVIDAAKAVPNVLNQGNVEEVAESTRAAVQARDPAVALEDHAEDRKHVAKAATKKVK